MEQIPAGGRGGEALKGQRLSDVNGRWGSDSVQDATLSVVGGLVGGVLAAAFVVAFTTLIKENLAWVLSQDNWIMLLAPFIGIAVAVLLLNLVARGQALQQVDGSKTPPRKFSSWLQFPANAVRADLTSDVVDNAGSEEKFPWRFAPIRAAAIFATVGMGAPMGTESPAAHLGVAAGSALGSLGQRWRSLARSAGVGGGAAGVAALMGLPLVGLAFMLELGRRNHAPLNLSRVLAAASGAFIGWGVNVGLDLDLIRLIVPNIPPGDLLRALATAALVGALSGVLGSVTGSAIYQARGWSASPTVKFATGGALLLICLLAISSLATPAAAIGPGAGAVTWAESSSATFWVLLAVVVLRALATTAAVMAGGCGGLFVPLLAIGDLSGRALAPILGVSGELAAAAGAAGSIAGGYRLPLTAIAMVLTVGGPISARLTCVAAVAFATAAGIAVSYLLDRYVLHR
ncbi:chloride channel protein [Corynebacterium comes]|uniref:H(+)/Cl(-) exchange transporter ClcA n=1 Tax=Corynebacterium comes TaxID=2675218 RepID=A0A6B8VXC7_9CORY|nr:chloride channel protein [Corynebacterium comes]QGU04801.1 H(+)/Cl(-) exchange transporter ClcA [Corynebacterium comes]